MKRRNLVNLLLLTGAVFLLAVAIYEPGIDVPSSPAALTPLSGDEINHIRIKQDGKREISLQRQDSGHWQMTTPYPLSANQHRVETLLQLADTSSLSSFDVHDHEIAAFGLSPPGVELTFNQLTLKFGDTDPLNGHRYVVVANKVHLINDTAYYSAIAGPVAFIDHALLPVNSNIEEIVLPRLRLWQDKDGWHAKSASESEQVITADVIATFVNEWQHSKAITIQPLDNDNLQGEIITLHLAGQETPIYFVITQRQPELKLVRPDLKLLYVLPAGSTTRLTELPATRTNAGTS